MTSKSGKIFHALSAMYGALWEREHGDSPCEDFNRWANAITKTQYEVCRLNCQRSMISGNQFAPSLGVLMAYSITPPDLELMDALARIRDGKPKNEIESWLVRNYSFDLRRVVESRELSMIKALYSKGVQLEAQGRIRDDEKNMLSLPENSVKNVNDLAREDYEKRNGRGLNARIEKILRGE